MSGRQAACTADAELGQYGCARSCTVYRRTTWCRAAPHWLAAAADSINAGSRHSTLIDEPFIIRLAVSMLRAMHELGQRRMCLRAHSCGGMRASMECDVAVEIQKTLAAGTQQAVAKVHVLHSESG